MPINSAGIPDGAVFLNGDYFPDFLNLMPTGIAYCQILFDNGLANDFVFLYTNTAFHQKTGLQKIYHQPFGNIKSDNATQNQQWLELIKNLSIDQTLEAFEFFDITLRQWLSIQAFYPKPDHFVIVLNSISEPKSRLLPIKNQTGCFDTISSDINFINNLLSNNTFNNSLKIPVTTSETIKQNQCTENKLEKRIISSLYQQYDSKCMLSNVFDNCSIGIVISHLEEGKIIEFNQAFLQILELSRDEILGRTSVELGLLPNILEREKLLAKVREQGKVINHDVSYTAKNGNILHLLASIHIMKAGNLKCLLVLISDITERKTQKQKILSTSNEIQVLYNKAPCGYHSIDKNGVFLYINDTELEWLECTRDEVIGKKKLTDFLSADGKQLFINLFPKFLATGHIENLQFELISKFGRIRQITLSASCIRDNEGNFIMSDSVCYDITELKKTLNEQQLKSEKQHQDLEANLNKSQKEKALLKDILKVSAQPFAAKHENGNMALFNTAFERLTGYSSDELYQISWATDLTPLEWYDFERQKLAELQYDGQSIRYEKEYITKNGTRLPVELFVYLKINPEYEPKRLLYAFVNDISERKQIERITIENEERWRFALQASNMGAWELNLIDNTTWRSLRHDQIFGYEQLLPEWSYHTLLQHVVDDDKSRLNNLFQRAINGISLHTSYSASISLA